MSIKLELPEITDLKPRILVVGVGGAGGNAINNMIESGLDGVEFIAANTDAQALSLSSAERRIQLGVNLTEGLGAGSRPEIGNAAAEEAIDELRSHFAGAHMVFIAAGMGGGTGTGAASVIARIAQEENALTVGVVTKPFLFEGSRRMRVAEAGVNELKDQVDTLIVIPNQNLFRVATKNTTFSEAFVMADQVLHSGIACITDLIVREGLINLDFADVKVVMANMGAAMMGMGEAGGDNRAVKAAEDAMANPLLDGVSVRGARGLVISIAGGEDLTLYEVDEAASSIREVVDPEAHIIVGATFDDSLKDRIRVSILASGLVVRSDQNVPGPSYAVDHAASSQGQSQQHMQLQQAQASPEAPAKGQSPKAEGLKKKLSDAIRTGRAEPMQLKPSQAVQGIGSKDGGEVWKAPGNVTIETGPPDLTSGPASASETSQNPSSSQSGFRPAAPATARREPRRMPVPDDFPVVGQRELQAKGKFHENDAGGESKAPKREGFFKRLKSAATGRKDGDDSVEPVAANVSEPMSGSQKGQNSAHSTGDGAVPITAADQGQYEKRARPEKITSPIEGGEDIDFPMIFQDRVKNG